MADADAFIQAMPDGYDTIVGERGVDFPVGRNRGFLWQEALLKEPSILILDDTTSGCRYGD